MRSRLQPSVRFLIIFALSTSFDSSESESSVLRATHDRQEITRTTMETWDFNGTKKEIGLVGIPVSCGQEKQGVEEGPAFLRAEGLVSRLKDLGHTVRDYGDVKVEGDSNFTSKHVMKSECVGKTSKNALNAVAEVLSSGMLSINLGGDHTMSIGTVSAHAMAVDSHISLLWVDAHSDINTPLSSPSGNIHGMPLAFLLHEMKPFFRKPTGMEWIQPCVRKDNFAYIALRAIDPYERYFMDKLGITLYSMEDIDRIGITEVIRLVLTHINPEGTRSLHVSFDIDSIDMLTVPSTGTPVIGGLSMRDALIIAEEVHRSGQLRVLDLAEVNPRLAFNEDAKRTINCGVDLISSFFGRERRGNLPLNLDSGVIEERARTKIPEQSQNETRVGPEKFPVNNFSGSDRSATFTLLPYTVLVILFFIRFIFFL